METTPTQVTAAMVFTGCAKLASLGYTKATIVDIFAVVWLAMPLNDIPERKSLQALLDSLLQYSVEQGRKFYNLS